MAAKNVQGFFKKLDYFLSDDTSYYIPKMKTLYYYAQSWIKGVTSDIEYEKGVQAIEFFKRMLESKYDTLNEKEMKIFDLLCSLHVLYIALKPCHEKSENFLKEKILNKIDKTRCGIQEIMYNI